MYCAIIKTIIGTKRKCSRFLYISTGIILTNLITHTPSIIVNIKSITMSYEASQILITTFYNSGIINPLIYFLAHPMARRYVKELSFTSKDPFSTTDLSEAVISRPQLVKQRRISRDCDKNWRFAAVKQRDLILAKATSSPNLDNRDQIQEHQLAVLRKLSPRFSLPEPTFKIPQRVQSLRFSNEERSQSPEIVSRRRSLILPRRRSSTTYEEL